MEKFKPYAKYGVAELLAVRDIRKHIMEIKDWDSVKELTSVVSACDNFEMAWKMQGEPLVYGEALRRMDEEYGILDSKNLFKLDDIIWRVKRL